MAQTGYTPILIYSSSTTTNAPSAGNLTNSTLGSELAINITDGKLFYKDNANAVQVIAWKTTPTTAGGTGLTSYTAGDLLYYATGTTLTKLAIGASGRWLGSSGTAPQWNAPAALTKTDDTNVTLTLGGSASTALLNAASLTLGWTGTLAVSRGGTGTGTAFTAGSIVFAGASGVYNQDNANLFWDDANNRFGVGTAAPNRNVEFAFSGGSTLGVSNSAQGAGILYGRIAMYSTGFSNSYIDYGGEIRSYSGGGVDFSDLRFYTAAGAPSTEKARIFASGGVSIGNTTDPGAANLSVNSKCIVSGTAITNIGGSSLNHEVYSNGNGAIGGYQLGAGGYVYNSYAVDNGGTYYHVFFSDAGTSHGSITSNGTNTTYATSSDVRLKENIVDSNSALPLINAIKIRSFDWIGKNKKQDFGVVAQELIEIFPDAVVKGITEEDTWGVDTSFLIPAMIKAIQEQQTAIEQLTLQISALKGQ